MPAYVVAWTTVTDRESGPEAMAGYGAASPDILAKFGGRYRFVGPGVEVLEGEWRAHGFVVLEFQSQAGAKAWWESEEYAPFKELRRNVATSTILSTPDA